MSVEQNLGKEERQDQHAQCRQSKRESRTPNLHELLDTDAPLIAQNQDPGVNVIAWFKLAPADGTDVRLASYGDEISTGVTAQDDPATSRYRKIERTKDYVILIENRLGNGSFGRVYKAKRVSDKSEDYVCVKQAQQVHSRDSPKNTLETEYKTLNILNPPCQCNKPEAYCECDQTDKVVKCYGLFYTECDHALLLMEYFEGDPLSTMISRAQNEYGSPDYQQITRNELLNVAIQLLKALFYIHGKGIIHSDIKPPNMLYNRSYETLKLIDFGLALYGQNKGKSSRNGTFEYMAPEIMGGEHGGYKSDVFSCGMTFYHMTTLTRPYNSLEHIRNAHYNERDLFVASEIMNNGTQELKAHMLVQTGCTNQDIREIVAKLLCYDYDGRPEILAALDEFNKLPRDDENLSSGFNSPNNNIGEALDAAVNISDGLDCIPDFDNLLLLPGADSGNAGNLTEQCPGDAEDNGTAKSDIQDTN